MAKQTKITIVLDQPLFGTHSEEVGRDLLGSRHCFGVYSSFDQSRVTFEEIDTEQPGVSHKVTIQVDEETKKKNLLLSRIWLMLSAHPDNQEDSEFADMIDSIEETLNNK